jgi:hypothetical protein
MTREEFLAGAPSPRRRLRQYTWEFRRYTLDCWRDETAPEFCLISGVPAVTLRAWRSEAHLWSRMEQSVQVAQDSAAAAEHAAASVAAALPGVTERVAALTDEVSALNDEVAQLRRQLRALLNEEAA